MTNDEQVSLITAQWCLTLMRRGFAEFALIFAAIDKDAALKAIHTVEVSAVASLTKFMNEQPEGVAIPGHILAELAGEFREMTQGAKEQIREMANPN